ncbi:MAG: hypothetical protein JSV23_02190, partial [Promethearchaeota archaeon]
FLTISEIASTFLLCIASFSSLIDILLLCPWEHMGEINVLTIDDEKLNEIYAKPNPINSNFGVLPHPCWEKVISFLDDLFFIFYVS